jgi:hypothetical protein
MRRRITCRFAAMSFAATAVALALFTTSASAHIGAPGAFSCRASAVRATAPVLFSEPEVANPAENPCASDFKQAASAFVPGLFTSGLVTAQTTLNPGGVPGGQANASVATATVTLGGTTITAQVLTAKATAGCGIEFPGPVAQGSSNVVGLQINGGPVITTSSPVTIPVNSLVTVYLNRTINSPGPGSAMVTQRALEVSSPALSTDVVAGEAIADASQCQTVK